MAGTSSADPLRSGRGHRPCHSTALGSGPAGGPKPPASARPATGGRFSPAGSGAGLSWCPWTCRSTGQRRARAGKRGSRFLIPPGVAFLRTSGCPVSLAGAIAPATAPRWDQDQPGATAPGQRPTRPRRALPARRVGRWPSVVPEPAGLQGTVPRGRGKRGSRFPIPPGLAKALSPLPWQGPSPLPQRCADPCPAGGQSPRPAPDPPTAGASRPPGRALACVVPGPAGLQGTVPHGRGNAGRVSCSRPNRRRRCHRSNGRGHRPGQSLERLWDSHGADCVSHVIPQSWRFSHVPPVASRSFFGP